MSINPKLSVVLASQNARTSVFDCLQSIKHQSQDEAVEIVVVDNSTDDTAEIIKREFPNVNLINAPKDKLIPEMWAIGIKRSIGEIIALTTTHFIPSENWIAETLRANQADTPESAARLKMRQTPIRFRGQFIFAAIVRICCRLMRSKSRILPLIMLLTKGVIWNL